MLEPPELVIVAAQGSFLGKHMDEKRSQCFEISGKRNFYFRFSDNKPPHPDNVGKQDDGKYGTDSYHLKIMANVHDLF